MLYNILLSHSACAWTLSIFGGANALLLAAPASKHVFRKALSNESMPRLVFGTYLFQFDIDTMWDTEDCEVLLLHAGHVGVKLVYAASLRQDSLQHDHRM
jgi:hypothetical protein